MVRSLFLFDTISFDAGETYMPIVSVLLRGKLSIDNLPVSVLIVPTFENSILLIPSAPVVYAYTRRSLIEPIIGASSKLRLTPLYTHESEYNIGSS